MYLNELRKYRRTLVNKILASDELISLILAAPPPVSERSNLIYSNIFPYPKVVGTTTNEGTYITMRINVPKVKNKTFKSINLWVYIFVHEKLMNTDRGLRTDLIAEQIDAILNGSMDFGLGRLALTSQEDIVIGDKFQGITLKYSAEDFNR